MAVFFFSLVGGTGNCPGTYGEYQSKCLKFVTLPKTTRSGAYTACHGDQNGWLATLDTYTLANGVIGHFNMISVGEDVYFGLSKTEACAGTGCNGKLVWDARTSETPSNTGHTANMKRYCAFRPNDG